MASESGTISLPSVEPFEPFEPVVPVASETLEESVEVIYSDRAVDESDKETGIVMGEREYMGSVREGQRDAIFDGRRTVGGGGRGKGGA